MKADAIELLQAEAESGSTNWRVYQRLGELLVRVGDYSAAGKAYLKYPYFSNVPDGIQLISGMTASVAIKPTTGN